MHPLDNACWHALRGPQARFARGAGLALRYDPQVAVFAAIPDEPSSAAWSALRDLVGIASGLRGASAARAPDVPGAPVRTSERGEAGSSAAVEELAADDAPEMLRLAEHARPGPFFARTHELGTYLGIRAGTASLIAMAGERLRLEGHTEISAVSTDEAHRKRGLAARLIAELVGRIAARGERAFLHVAADNVGAIRLYETLGFTTRRNVEAVGLLAPE